MKSYSVTGWWNQPRFQALDIRRGQAVVTTIKNSHAFTGIIVANSLGIIDAERSALFDKNGLAFMMAGQLSLEDGKINFDKRYASRPDIISYEAVLNRDEDCWRGTFRGTTVGEGTTAFVIRELPVPLFRME